MKLNLNYSAKKLEKNINSHRRFATSFPDIEFECKVPLTPNNFNIITRLILKNIDRVINCLNRAFELLDLTISVPCRQNLLKESLRFRGVLAQFYINKDKNPDEFAKIFKILLMLNKSTSLIKF